MKKPLNIFFKKDKVGTLTKKPDDTLEFKYCEEWSNNKKNFPLTPALPIQEEPFNNRLSKSYFDNLLPEGDTLKTFEKLLNKSFEDPYQLLESYGLDCAGALEITPLDEPPENFLNGNAEKISFAEIDKVIESRGSLYVHAIKSHKGRFSLAGAQDKIPVIYHHGEILIPQDASPTTHILKPPTRISGVYETAYNEFLSMKIAELVGLNIPEIQLVGEENPLFLIARYDRQKKKTGYERIHQFDLCQAQGYPAAEKYEDDGGPSFEQDYKTIQKHSGSKIHDLTVSLRWLSFNLVIGNNDSHSKNLSFLLKDESLELSPLYDLMSTAVYNDMTTAFAFSFGGQREWHELKKTHFQTLARNLGFEKRENIVIDQLLKECDLVEEKGLPFVEQFIKDNPSSKIATDLRAEIVKRISVFRKKMGS